MHAMAFAFIMSHIITNAPHTIQMLIRTSDWMPTARKNKRAEFNLTLEKMGGGVW